MRRHRKPTCDGPRCRRQSGDRSAPDCSLSTGRILVITGCRRRLLSPPLTDRRVRPCRIGPTRGRQAQCLHCTRTPRPPHDRGFRTCRVAQALGNRRARHVAGGGTRLVTPHIRAGPSDFENGVRWFGSLAPYGLGGTCCEQEVTLGWGRVGSTAASTRQGQARCCTTSLASSRGSQRHCHSDRVPTLLRYSAGDALRCSETRRQHLSGVRAQGRAGQDLAPHRCTLMARLRAPSASL